MVKKLLEYSKVKVDIKHKHSRTTLYLAIFTDRIELVYILLLRGYILIYLAIKCNCLEVVDLLLSHLYANVNCTDKDENTPLWLSIYLSFYKITKRLLAKKDIDVNLIRGCRRFEMPSTSLHHTVARLDSMLLRRLFMVPEIDLNLCVAGHSLISIAASCRCVSMVVCLLNMGNVEINGRGLIDLPLCRMAVYGYHDVVRLLILLLHNKIDVNLWNEYFEDLLMLVVNNGHFLIVCALLANTRL
ncbi:unnamed protein product [Penicillium salamii]|nr:unnamed protein product [Penicillium salamii]